LKDINYESLISPFFPDAELAAQLEQLDQEAMNPCWNHAAWQSFFLEKAEGRYLLSLAHSKKAQKLIGFALFQLVPEEELAHLLKIAVSEKFRRQAVARNLFADFLPCLQKRGIRKMFLEVEESNLAAISFYEAQGFKKLHTMQHFYGFNRHGVSMLWQVAE